MLLHAALLIYGNERNETKGFIIFSAIGEVEFHIDFGCYILCLFLVPYRLDSVG